MSPTEAIPLLVVVLLLVSVGGGDVRDMSVTFEGDTDLDTHTDVHVAAGGTTTLQAADSTSGEVYVIGGRTVVEGTLDGNLTLLSGNVSVTDGATITGTVRAFSGRATIHDGATIGSVARFETPAPSNSVPGRIGGLVMQFLGLAAAGWWLVTRHPVLLRNVGQAITGQTLASGVVGALGSVSLLVLFVYMAFTILLIPVAVLGLLGELLVVLYGQIAFGYLIGEKSPIDRPPWATVFGIGLLVLFTEAISVLPYLGAVIQGAIAVVGFGAVLNTYFGFTPFEPVRIPG
jgi:cytoskeletal protein CcmA (bactofilin family)